MVKEPIKFKKMCDNHDIAWPLMGKPCPNCGRVSLYTYEPEEKTIE